MLPEIGSEFWEVNTTEGKECTLFPQSTHWYLCGRSALQAIISELSQKLVVKYVGIPTLWLNELFK